MIPSHTKRDFIDDIFNPCRTFDEIVRWFSNQLDPEDVFTELQLRQWAEANGYVKEE